jgi:hypothetical protein
VLKVTSGPCPATFQSDRLQNIVVSPTGRYLSEKINSIDMVGPGIFQPDLQHC